jgi:hypothetical protein
MRILEGAASHGQIADFLRHEVAEHFGLSPEHYDIAGVARGIRKWFRERWADTHVAG